MIGFHEKRKLQRFLHSPYFLVFLVVPVCLLVYAAYNAFAAERETRMHRVELEEQLMALEARAEALEADIARLEDPYGIEAELRHRYDVGWEGEESIVLIDEEVDEEEPVLVPSEEESSWWAKVWAKF